MSRLRVYQVVVPQRSRRLSASGIGSGKSTPARASRLKEADAFQRLVYDFREMLANAHLTASKKQTPFSVWYWRCTPALARRRCCLKEADAFQRLVLEGDAHIRGVDSRLKEADAFQRLV